MALDAVIVTGLFILHPPDGVAVFTPNFVDVGAPIGQPGNELDIN
jgi:hypothetical protein